MNVKDKVFQVIGKFGFDNSRYQQLMTQSDLTDTEVKEFLRMTRLLEMAESSLSDLGEYVNWQLERIHHRLEKSFPLSLPSEQKIPTHAESPSPEITGMAPYGDMRYGGYKSGRKVFPKRVLGNIDR